MTEPLLDPLEPILQLRKRLDRLDQARSPAEALKTVPALLEGLVSFRAVRTYLSKRQGFEPAAEGEGSAFPVSPKLLDWAASAGEVSSVPVEGSGETPMEHKSLLMAAIPGQFRPLGVLVLSRDEDPGKLSRASVLLIGLLVRELGRALENLRVYEQMQRLRELLDNIVESVPHGILAAGPDDAVIAYNRNCEVLFGIPRIDVLGERYKAALPRGLAEVLSGMAVAVLQEGVVRDAEFKRELSPTESLPIGISCTLLRDKEARPQGLLFICRDLSLSMEVEKLRELDRMKSEFVHTVSHELKTPLTAILGSTEMLMMEKESLPQDLHEVLDILDTGGKRLHALITDLLDLSRLESGRIGLEREETDLPSLIREAVQNVKHKNPKCAAVLELPEGFPACMADGDKLRQVFENFIGNAFKYSPKGGEVRVTLQKEGDRIRFGVKDQGIGIAKEHIPMLFEKFFRVDSSTTSEIEGTGLGLTIVKHIIELHEGEVTVESELGKGSTFGFVIPYIPPQI